MKIVVGMIVAGVVLCSAEMLLHPSMTAAQAPPARPAETRSATSGGPVERLLAFDTDHDGKLTKAELTDERLQNLLARADADKDGTVTREELTALFARETPAANAGGRGFGGPGGPGGRGFSGPGAAGAQGDGAGPRGFGGPGGPGGRGGSGGPGGRGGGPQPGQIMPTFMQERLNLSDEQKSKVEALQNEVDSRLEKILTADQQKQLKAMREGGPGGRGFGSPVGPGGPDGFGPPPGGFGPPPGGF